MVTWACDYMIDNICLEAVKSRYQAAGCSVACLSKKVSTVTIRYGTAVVLHLEQEAVAPNTWFVRGLGKHSWAQHFVIRSCGGLLNIPSRIYTSPSSVTDCDCEIIEYRYCCPNSSGLLQQGMWVSMPPRTIGNALKQRLSPRRQGAPNSFQYVIPNIALADAAFSVAAMMRGRDSTDWDLWAARRSPTAFSPTPLAVWEQLEVQGLVPSGGFITSRMV